jgi:hypothetical protein
LRLVVKQTGQERIVTGPTATRHTLPLPTLETALT